MRCIVLLIIIILMAGCAQKEVKQMGELKLTSPVFKNNGNIPDKYTCDGENISPELNISGIPNETKSLALIFDDPDATAGTFVHWIVFNIKPISKIEENSIPGIQGRNNFGKNDYGGPCPPSGMHGYIFRLYALDITLDLNKGSDKKDVENAMEGHILAQTQLVGLYGRG